MVANTREVCLVTHADPRCLASCVAVTTAVCCLHSVDLGSMLMNYVPGAVGDPSYLSMFLRLL